MNRLVKFVFGISIFVYVFLAGGTNLNVKAMGNGGDGLFPGPYKVISDVPLKVRDANCNIVGFLQPGQTINPGDGAANATPSCLIDGVMYEYLPIVFPGEQTNYSAKIYLEDIGQNNTEIYDAVVTSEIGVNVRDESCNIQFRLAKNTTVQAVSSSKKLCTVDGLEYDYTQISYNGKKGYIASIYLGNN